VAGFLEKVLADKRLELEARRREVPLDQLKARVQGLPRCRNFYKAVTRPNPRGVNVIAEVKKASPSAGLIRADLDPVQIAQTYQRCGADAISVLTDERYFQGSLEYLTAIKAAVSLPVLCKDFIIDPYQVYEARAAGADAILLIAEALSVGQLSDLLILASQLTLTVLLEVHSPEVLLNVRSLVGFPQRGFSVLGINNRDLRSLHVDINTFCRLAALIDPADGLVAESGISSREDVQKMVSAGATAVLVGQALCQDPDIEGRFNDLFGPTGRLQCR